MNLAQSTSSYSEFGEQDVKDIVIRSYTIVGELTGLGQSTIHVEAREAIIPDRNMADYCVRLELNTGGDYPQSSFASIEYKDINTLVEMLRKLEVINITTERFHFSEVQYEIDGFRVVVFNTDRGSAMAALSHGGVTIHLSSPSKLSYIADLVERAKSHLDQYKI